MSTPDSAEPVLIMTGDIDIASEGEWRQRAAEVLAAHPRASDLVVDMRDVGFIDSRGMAVLVGLHASALERGGRLSLQAVPRRIVRALSVAGLDKVFAVSAI